MSLWRELRRRNVFKVGVAYLVLGWLVVQITDTIAPALGLPAWTLTLVVWLGAVGLPFALLFAWAFELTPDGVKRTDDVEPSQSITRTTGIKLNFVIIGLLVAVIAALLAERFWFRDIAGEEDVPAVANDAARYDSIAVLPFANLSEDPANEHFGDGLAEELLNLLAGVDDLKVAARTSTFYFKDKNPTIEEVAEALGVDTIVEGSVRRSGDTIRVVVQLISAQDGSHLWAQRYDRSLDDLFAVQDDIAGEIVAALMPELGIEALPSLADAASKISPEMFEQFMLARRAFYTESVDRAWAARDGFLAVTKAAPAFAPGWAWLARSVISLENLREMPESESRPIAREAIDTALALEPDNALALLAEGEAALADGDWEGAVGHLDRALEDDPNNVDVLVALEHALFHLDRFDEAIAALEKARTIDPLHPDVLWELAHKLNLKGEVEEAFSALSALYRVDAELAFDIEMHLYTDSGQFGLALYLSRARDVPDQQMLTYIGRVLGLHDDPILLESDYRATSLAVLGERERAIAALQEDLAGIANAGRRSGVEWGTYLALDDYQSALDVLWQRWEQHSAGAPDAEMDSFGLIPLAALLQHPAQPEQPDRLAQLPSIIAPIKEFTDHLSPVHSGAYNYLKALAALVEGDRDTALVHLQEVADRGEPGSWTFGTPFPYVWLYEDDPRFGAVMEQLSANRDAQLAEYQRLVSGKFSHEAARADYLSSVGSSLD